MVKKYRDFLDDVISQIYMGGGNPDGIDEATIENCWSEGCDAGECASVEIRRQRKRREQKDREPKISMALLWGGGNK